MIAVAIGLAFRMTAPAETEDAAMRKAIARCIDDFKIADQMKRTAFHDVTFDD
jgi:hypothetical protein